MLISGLITSPADATLIATDHPVFGPDALTYDTGTGLYWLDLTFSTNRSYNEVAAELGPGGDFEGFRYTSIQEVTQLFANAGIHDGVFPVDNPPPGILQLIQLLGTTGDLVGFTGFSGTPVLDPDEDPPIRNFAAEIYLMDGTWWVVLTDDFIGRSAAFPWLGSFLVIPEPQTALLIGAGLVAFGVVSRTRRRRAE